MSDQEFYYLVVPKSGRIFFINYMPCSVRHRQHKTRSHWIGHWIPAELLLVVRCRQKEMRFFLRSSHLTCATDRARPTFLFKAESAIVCWPSGKISWMNLPSCWFTPHTVHLWWIHKRSEVDHTIRTSAECTSAVRSTTQCAPLTRACIREILIDTVFWYH